jgi:WD40 repeat protein
MAMGGQEVASGSFDGTVKLWETKTGTCLRTLQPERRYQRMDITGLTGVSDAQRTALLALGAVEQHGPSGETTGRMTRESVP